MINSLVDIAVQTIVSNNLCFPKVLYIYVNLGTILKIIKYDREDIIDRVMKFPSSDKLVEIWPDIIDKMLQWRSIKCFNKIGLQKIDKPTQYIDSSQHFIYRRIINGFYEKNHALSFNNEETYELLKNGGWKNLQQLKSVFPNWPPHIGEEASSHLLEKNLYIHSSNYFVIAKFLNNLTKKLHTKAFEKFKSILNDQMLYHLEPSLLIKLYKNSFVPKEKAISHILCKSGDKFTLRNLKDLSVDIKLSRIKFVFDEAMLNSDVLPFLIDTCDFNFIQRCFMFVLQTLPMCEHDDINPNVNLDKIFEILLLLLDKGCSLDFLIPYIKYNPVELSNIYIKRVGSPCNIFYYSSVKPQDIAYQFSDKTESNKKETVDCIEHYLSKGDLDTIKYIVSTLK